MADDDRKDRDYLQDGANFAALCAIAAKRGEVWASELREATKQPSIRFPAESDYLRAIARERLADMTSEVELLNQLADEMLAHAAVHWDAAKP